MVDADRGLRLLSMSSPALPLYSDFAARFYFLTVKYVVNAGWGWCSCLSPKRRVLYYDVAVGG